MRVLVVVLLILCLSGCDYGGPDSRVALPNDPPDLFVVAEVNAQMRLVRILFGNYGTSVAVQSGVVLGGTGGVAPPVRSASPGNLTFTFDLFQSSERFNFWTVELTGTTGFGENPTVFPANPEAGSPGLAPVSEGGSEPLISRFEPGVFNSARLGTNPAGIGVTEDLRTAVVADHGAVALHVYDIAARALLSSIRLPGASQPYAVAMGPGDLAYVTSLKQVGSSLLAVDVARRAVVREWNTGDYPAGVAVKPDGSQVWVTSWASNNALIIDLLSGSTITQVPGLDDAWGITFNPTGTRAYVAAATPGQGNVIVIDTSTYTQIAKIPVGSEPRQVRVTPSGRHVFASNFGGDSVTQIDTATNRVVRHITVGRSPTALALAVP